MPGFAPGMALPTRLLCQTQLAPEGGVLLREAVQSLRELADVPLQKFGLWVLGLRAQGLAVQRLREFGEVPLQGQRFL